MTNQNQRANSILGLVRSVDSGISPKLININEMEIAKAIAKEISNNGDMNDRQTVNVANLVKTNFTTYEDEMFASVVEFVRNKYSD